MFEFKIRNLRRRSINTMPWVRWSSEYIMRGRFRKSVGCDRGWRGSVCKTLLQVQGQNILVSLGFKESRISTINQTHRECHSTAHTQFSLSYNLTALLPSLGTPSINTWQHLEHPRSLETRVTNTQHYGHSHNTMPPLSFLLHLHHHVTLALQTSDYTSVGTECDGLFEQNIGCTAAHIYGCTPITTTHNKDTADFTKRVSLHQLLHMHINMRFSSIVDLTQFSPTLCPLLWLTFSKSFMDLHLASFYQILLSAWHGW